LLASLATAEGNPRYGPARKPSLFAMFLTTSNELSPQLFFPGNCCNVFARSIGFVQHTAMALATQAFGIDVQFGSLIFCNGALRRFFTLLLLLFEEEEEGEALFVVSPLSVEEYFFPNGMRGSRPPLNALEEEAEDLTDMISPSLSLSVCVFYASQRSSPLLSLSSSSSRSKVLFDV
jgi:hypothetical protein